MAAKFEIRSKAGQFRWVLTSQGRTLAIGEAYTRKVKLDQPRTGLLALRHTPMVPGPVPSSGQISGHAL